MSMLSISMYLISYNFCLLPFHETNAFNATNSSNDIFIATIGSTISDISCFNNGRYIPKKRYEITRFIARNEKLRYLYQEKKKTIILKVKQTFRFNFTKI